MKTSTRNTGALLPFLRVISTIAAIILFCAPGYSQTVYSELWGENGELWNPNRTDGPRLKDFTTVGYEFGNQPLPDWPVGINVKTWSGPRAVGDGIADDTEAIRQAIENCPPEHAVYLPPGTYKITQQILIHRSQVVIRGAGKYETTLFFPKTLARTSIFDERHAGLLSELIRENYLFDQNGESYLGRTLMEVDGFHDQYGNPVSKSAAGASHNLRILVLRQKPNNGAFFKFTALTLQEQYDQVKGLPVPNRPPITHVGVESIGFIFPSDPASGHQGWEGACSIDFIEVNHGWVRDVYMKNVENGIHLTSSQQCTLRDIIIDHDPVRPTTKVTKNVGGGGPGNVGHYGINLRGNTRFNLVHNIFIKGRFHHPLIFNDNPSDNVFSRITGDHVNLQHHSQGGSGNLFTEMNGNRSPFVVGGDQNETIWNATMLVRETQNAALVPPEDSDSHGRIVVGVYAQPDPAPASTADYLSKSATHHYECLTPERIHPQNMYLAQMAFREKAFEDTYFPEAPSLAQDGVLQDAVDGMAFIRMSKDNTPFTEPFMLLSSGPNSPDTDASIYLKFDLQDVPFHQLERGVVRLTVSGTSTLLPDGSVDRPELIAQALVDTDIAVESIKNFDPPALQEGILPSGGCTYFMDETTGMVHVDLDLTDYLNDVLDGDRAVALRIAGGEEATDRWVSVHAYFNNFPPVLLLEPKKETLPTSETLVQGTVIGSEGSFFNRSTQTAAAAFDRDLNSFYHAANSEGDWVGLDLGTSTLITEVRFAPRSSFYANRMVGGRFEGSTSADFSTGVQVLHTITEAPQTGTMTGVLLQTPGTYRYVRYIGPQNSWCNVAELEFHTGEGAPPPPPPPPTGTDPWAAHLIHHYPFTPSAPQQDQVGTLDFLNPNGVTFHTSEGVNYASFDGLDDVLYWGDPGSTTTQLNNPDATREVTFTITMFMRPRDLPQTNGATLLGFPGPLSYSKGYARVLIANDGQGSDDTITVQGRAFSGSADDFFQRHAGTPQKGQWNLVTLEVDGEQDLVRMWVNDQPAVNIHSQGIDLRNIHYLLVGGNPDTGLSFAGDIANIRIYDRAGWSAALQSLLMTPAAPTPSTPPVDGYTRWFDASQLSAANGEAVSTWEDQSGNGAHATIPGGNAAPVYVADAGTGTGLGALYFARNGGANTSAALRFPEEAAIRTVISVFKGNSFLLTSANSYDFHRPGNFNDYDPLWHSRYVNKRIRNGETFVNGVPVNGTTSTLPTGAHNGFNIITVTTTDVVKADSFNKDRRYHAGDQYQAEVLIYDRVLTTAEREAVESYLAAKWFGQDLGPQAAASPVNLASLDGDGDGVASYFEYMYGSDPSSGADSGFQVGVEPADTPGSLAYTWEFAEGYQNGVDFVIMFSTDLVTWDPLPSEDYSLNEITENGSTRYRLDVQLENADQIFIALRQP